MKNYDSLLKANCCCIKDENVVYVSEEYRLFFEFDTTTGETQLLNWPILKGRPCKLFYYKNVFYALDSHGKWIARLAKNAMEFDYIEIPRDFKFTAFLYTCVVDGVLYMLHKDTLELIVYYIETECFKSEKVSLPIELIQLKTDVCTLANNNFYIFCSNVHKVIVYSLTDFNIVYINDIISTKRFMYASFEQEDVYTIAANTIYKFKNKELLPIVRIPAEKQLTKLCVTSTHIWALPGQAADIYSYSIKDQVLHTIKNYPEDYHYESKEGWTKFAARIQKDDNIFWLMRVGNYSLGFNKVNGKQWWIKHDLKGKVTFLEELYKKSSYIGESYVSLEDFLRYVAKRS